MPPVRLTPLRLISAALLSVTTTLHALQLPVRQYCPCYRTTGIRQPSRSMTSPHSTVRTGALVLPTAGERQTGTRSQMALSALHAALAVYAFPIPPQARPTLHGVANRALAHGRSCAERPAWVVTATLPLPTG